MKQQDDRAVGRAGLAIEHLDAVDRDLAVVHGRIGGNRRVEGGKKQQCEDSEQ